MNFQTGLVLPLIKTVVRILVSDYYFNKHAQKCRFPAVFCLILKKAMQKFVMQKALYPR